MGPVPDRSGDAAVRCAGLGGRGGCPAAGDRRLRIGVAPGSLGDRPLPLDAHRRADRGDGGHGDPRRGLADHGRDPQLEAVHPGCSRTGGWISPTSCALRRCGTPSPRTLCCRAATSSCSELPPFSDSWAKTCSPDGHGAHPAGAPAHIRSEGMAQSAMRHDLVWRDSSEDLAQHGVGSGPDPMARVIGTHPARTPLKRWSSRPVAEVAGGHEREARIIDAS